MSGTDYTRTLNLGLYKPVYNADAEMWGTHLNSNADILDGALTAGGGTITGPLNYTATGTITSRSAQDRAADHVHAKDFGAIFDGNSHPLSAYFSTLAAAQVVYPKATSLTNEIDGIAVQAALDFCAARSGSANDYSYGGTVVLPNGKGLMNTPLTISTSCVSLDVYGRGITMRELVSRFVQSAPCHLLWTGPAVASGGAVIYMLTIAVTDGGRRISGSNVNGVFFDANGTTGISGVLIMSAMRSQYYLGVAEARGVNYPGSVLTSGSRNITVSSSTNMQIGQAITSASMPPGAYVSSIISGTVIQSSIQASASATETTLIGGECVRLDCVSGITDVNDCQENELELICLQETGAQYSYGPCIVLNGSSTGSAAGGTHYGNTSINRFDRIECGVNYGAGLVINNTDHNYFLFVAVGGFSATPQGIVLNGSPAGNNGGAAFNMFDYVVGASIYAQGTDTGGFTSASAGNAFRNADTQNGVTIGHIGTGATLAFSNVGAPTLMSNYNSGAPMVPYPADGTAIGGSARGINAVDLQLARTANTQVASGNYSFIGGGNGNTASAIGATVLGYNNTASGQFSTATGFGTTASGNYSIATGASALADLYALRTHSSGQVSSGRRAQQQVQVLSASSAANTTPVRLTADGAAAGALNVMNLTVGNETLALSVQLSAMDATWNNAYVWQQPLGLLRRAGGVGAVTYTPGTPTSTGQGTTTGIAITEAADTVNGGYSLTFTPPTGNTQVWHICATVTATRVDAV